MQQVKVLIERWIRAGYEEFVWHLLRELRAEAVRTHGYVYGETLRSVDNPRVLLSISVWASRERWEQWTQNEARQRIDERINRMLRRLPTVRIYENAAEPLPRRRRWRRA